MPLAGAIIGGLGLGLAGYNTFFGGPDEEEMAQQQAAERQRAKDAQYKALAGLQAPTTSQSTLNRIKALQEMSKPGALIEDPYFQGARAQLVQGGTGALSQIGNRQRATGATGGFSNVGSMQDVLDRTSVALAGLGQQSAERKDKASAEAAQMEQAQLDAQMQFNNARQQMIMAIEAGDSAAAIAAMQQANAAAQRSQQLQAQFGLGVAGGMAQVFGPAWLGSTAPDVNGYSGNLDTTYTSPYFGSSIQQPAPAYSLAGGAPSAFTLGANLPPFENAYGGLKSNDLYGATYNAPASPTWASMRNR